MEFVIDKEQQRFYIENEYSKYVNIGLSDCEYTQSITLTKSEVFNLITELTKIYNYICNEEE